MSTRTITVVCSGNGSHKRHPFNQFTFDGDQVSMRDHRVASKPQFLGLEDDDGATVIGKAVMPPLYDPRTGRDSWRWECPYCHCRRRLSTDELRACLQGLQGRRVLDLSLDIRH